MRYWLPNGTFQDLDHLHPPLGAKVITTLGNGFKLATIGRDSRYEELSPRHEIPGWQRVLIVHHDDGLTIFDIKKQVKQIVEYKGVKLRQHQNWVFEQSSGYSGWRCTKCIEWIYDAQHFTCRCEFDKPYG